MDGYEGLIALVRGFSVDKRIRRFYSGRIFTTVPHGDDNAPGSLINSIKTVNTYILCRTLQGYSTERPRRSSLIRPSDAPDKGQPTNVEVKY